MAGIDEYRTRGDYPDFDKPKPKKRYCLRGETLPKTLGVRNPGATENEIFSIIVAANNANNLFGTLDINITAGPAPDPLDGTPIPDNKITEFTPGLVVEFNEGVSLPVGVPPFSEYGRSYAPSNGGEDSVIVGQGAIPPGVAIFAEFTNLNNVDEYTVIFEVEAAENLG